MADESKKPRGFLYFCTCFKISDIDEFLNEKLSTSFINDEPENEKDYKKYLIYKTGTAQEDAPSFLKDIISKEKKDDPLKLSSCEIYTNKKTLGVLVSSYTLWDDGAKDIVKLSETFCNKAWSWGRANGKDPSNLSNQNETKDFNIMTAMTKMIEFVIDNPPNNAPDNFEIELIVPSDEISCSRLKFKSGHSNDFFKQTSEADSMGSSFIFSCFSANGIDEVSPDKLDEQREKEAEENFHRILNNLEAAAADIHFLRYTPLKRYRESFSDRLYSMSLPTGQSIVHRYKKLVTEESNKFFVPFVLALMSKIEFTIESLELSDVLDDEKEQKPENYYDKAKHLLKQIKAKKDNLSRTISNNAAGKNIAIHWLKKTNFLLILKQAEETCEQIINSVDGAEKDNKDSALLCLSAFAIFSTVKDFIDLLGFGDCLWVTISGIVISALLIFVVSRILDIKFKTMLKTFLNRIKNNKTQEKKPKKTR